MWYFVKTPLLLKLLLPRFIWSKKSDDVFLTFDDGPTKGNTKKILAILKEHNVLATFFCVGENVQQNPSIYKEITDGGHAIGNHTMYHSNGWKTSSKKYIEDIDRGSKHIKSTLFRPPYGKINFSAARKIREKYEVIMWDIVSGDFDAKCPAEKVVYNVVNNIQKGSIVVLHDNKNFGEKTIAALPIIIEEIKKKNLSFNKLNDGRDLLHD